MGLFCRDRNRSVESFEHFFSRLSVKWQKVAGQRSHAVCEWWCVIRRKMHWWWWQIETFTFLLLCTDVVVHSVVAMSNWHLTKSSLSPKKCEFCACMTWSKVCLLFPDTKDTLREGLELIAPDTIPTLFGVSVWGGLVGKWRIFFHYLSFATCSLLHSAL